MHIDLDILVYAVIALLVFARLWYVLGTRNEGERQRPNPFTPPIAQQPIEPPPPVVRAMAAPLPAASLAGGLAQIATLDPNFQEKAFLLQARDIFSVTVAAYVAGDLGKISDLLTPALRTQFQQAIDQRNAEGHRAETRIVALLDAEVIAARAEGSEARVTVQITSNQTNVLRDKSGTVIGGIEDKLETLTDIWVFTRDIARDEAKWQVAETRS